MKKPIGIIAGGGVLPWELAQRLTTQGNSCFVVALKGFATPPADTHIPYIELAMGQVRSIFEAFHNHNCHKLVLLGPVKRPPLHRLSLDFSGWSMLLRIGRAWFKGDDNLLRSIIKLLEMDGFKVVGAQDLVPEFMTAKESQGCRDPLEDEIEDIKLGFGYLASVSAQDIGQACVVSEGMIVALEGKEGTDALLSAAVAQLKCPHKAILVKTAKITQDLRVDMPTIGLNTAKLVTSLGMAGIAIEKDKVLVVDLDKVSDCLAKSGCFLSIS